MVVKAPWNLDRDLAADLAAPSRARDLRSLLALIARHSMWVHPDIAREVPVVFPKAARRRQTTQRIGSLVRGIRRWDNRPAAFAFYAALGSTWHRWINSYVCHIYPGSAFSPDHFTRLANLVAVPRTLWAFTDWSVVEGILQRRSYELYGWRGPDRTVPPVLPGYPADWSPLSLPARPPATVGKLRTLGGKYPGFWVYRRTMPSFSMSRVPPAESTIPASGDLSWFLPPLGPRLHPQPFGKTRSARDLDSELWAALRGSRRLLGLMVRLVRRHAYFPPVRVVRSVPNPFPRVRRIRPNRGERPGQVIDGVTLATNLAAADAFAVALGRPVNGIEGGVVDHAWPSAVQLPAHFCHLGGLVLVPQALGSLVDSPPIRALLQRRLYERTGYAGPSGIPPPPSPLMPRVWPENLHFTMEHDDRSIARLEELLAGRPGYFPRRPTARRRSRSAHPQLGG